MDSITHLSQKILAERARQGSQQQRPTPPESAPPPYTPADSDDDSDGDQEDDDSSPPVKLTINAAHSIQGSNNLVPTSPTPLADATKFGAILLQAVNQINNVTSAPNLQGRRAVRVDLTINCGITVVGDRNVIGNVGLKPKAAMAISGPSTEIESNAVAGAKRKAEEVSLYSMCGVVSDTDSSLELRR